MNRRIYMEIPVQALAFQTEGTPIECIEYGNGHINRTLLVTTDARNKYILQRINKYVFKQPENVVANAHGVTEFLREKTGDPRSALHYIADNTGKFCHCDAEGEYWRMYDFVEAICLEAPETLADFYQSAVAFGTFQAQLADYPVSTLYEIIPNFHNTVDRFRQLKEAIANDTAGRKAACAPEIEFALSQEEVGGTLQRMLEAGELPLRVTHNDTKLNNVLLDTEKRTALCVIDLDTVMPGLSAFDFGDSIRFGAATTKEDDPEPANMKMDLERFEAYTKGFLSAATALTNKEIEVLPYGALIMTLEVGIRFLADYLNGDVYFRTHYPEHNLVRCRTQFALVADMLSKWEEMNKIVAQVRNSL